MKTILVILISVLILGCNSNSALEVNSSSSPSWEELSPNTLEIASTKPLITCEFIGAQALSDILKNHLGITLGDVQIGTSSDNRPVYKIASHAEALGIGDVTLGKPDDLSCTTTKFKISAELMIEACTNLMSNIEAKNKLFPQGPYNSDAIYQILIGRKPSLYESSILSQLADALPLERKESGICAAVASSLEALIRI